MRASALGLLAAAALLLPACGSSGHPGASGSGPHFSSASARECAQKLSQGAVIDDCSRGDTDLVTVPNVVGMTPCEAMKVLVRARLIPNPVLRTHLDSRIGRQDPVAGSRVRRRSRVTIDMDSGPTTSPSNTSKGSSLCIVRMHK